MGSDAEIFIFDYETYTSEVVPAFQELLLTGLSSEWLHPIIDSREIRIENVKRTDILRYCTYLNKDFSWCGPYDEKDIYGSKWEERACESEVCPERDQCPFHKNSSSSITEELNWLFEVAVSIKCLGPCQFVGRSMTVLEYWSLLFDLGIQPDNPLLNLLLLLGKRGFVIGYQWGFGFEGINGWLDPQQTLELARRLEELSLPKYEASLEAMEGFKKPYPILEIYERFGGTVYEHPGVSFEALSLSFVRTMAKIATMTGKGILWGNGVMPADFYLKKFSADHART